jgi:hypothetical protein
VIGQPLNPHIYKLILQNTTTTIHNAMSALREQQERGTRIRNPLGWLVKALKGGFTSNTAKQAAKKAASVPWLGDRPAPLPSLSKQAENPEPPKIPDDFPEWFTLAHPLGVATGSAFIGGEFVVNTRLESLSWDEMRMIWPLARLRELAAPPSPEPPQPVAPAHNPAIDIYDPSDRERALASAKMKYDRLSMRHQAIKVCEQWGFEIGPNGPQEVEF